MWAFLYPLTTFSDVCLDSRKCAPTSASRRVCKCWRYLDMAASNTQYFSSTQREIWTEYTFCYACANAERQTASKVHLSVLKRTMFALAGDSVKQKPGPEGIHTQRRQHNYRAHCLSQVLIGARDSLAADIIQILLVSPWRANPVVERWRRLDQKHNGNKLKFNSLSRR